MSLLKLSNIGKIYVSEGNVTVGIRGVNLEFDKGEFVAVTGKSGSGKSTLLNVIGGVDTYEEGELYIEGEPTSHYEQADFEEYREKYISFIFQDYNIIDSFTVLQNVELALLHIENKAERRKRALELIERVGLSTHARHKGSHLSGGQKQRTVIARALAKNSPIILADEPTGNLDSETAKEIIKLLYELSRDRLIIVVTHSLDELMGYADRHIRIFDGTVELDSKIAHDTDFGAENKKDGEKTSTDSYNAACAASDSGRARRRRLYSLKCGFELGSATFRSKPKLSAFMIFLMLLGAVGIFLITTLCSEADTIFKKSYMFEHVQGRVVVVKDSGAAMTEAEIEALANKHGASFIQYDLLLDVDAYAFVSLPDTGERIEVSPRYGENCGDKILGRYPEAEDELFLYLPISYKPTFGKRSLLVDRVEFCGVEYKVVGVSYFYDNNLKSKCLFTKEGFETATAIATVMNSGNASVTFSVTDGSLDAMPVSLRGFRASFEAKDGFIYIDDAFAREARANAAERFGTDELFFSASVVSKYYSVVNYGAAGGYSPIVFTANIPNDKIEIGAPLIDYPQGTLLISPILLREVMQTSMDGKYRQCSLFFEDDEAAELALDEIKSDGFVAVMSNTTYEPSGAEVVLELIRGILVAFLWLIGIAFVAFFVYLCAGRAVGAERGEISIMRSMGIPTSVIKLGMAVRIAYSLIPAFLATVAIAALIFTSPYINSLFVYLYPIHYALIFAGLIILVAVTFISQLRQLFGSSVKHALRESK